MARHWTSLRAASRALLAEQPRQFASRLRRGRGVRVAALLVGLLVTRTAIAEKTDVVVLANGDHFTGEIKGLSHGQLDFKTDDAGRLSVEWIKIARVTSTHSFEVEMGSNTKYYGPLHSPADGQLAIGAGDTTVVVLIVDVVSVTPMDDYFWARVKAYLDVGFTLAKSNSSLTLSGDGSFAYRGQHLGAGIAFNTYIQNDKNSTAVAQGSVQLTGNYYLSRWRFELVLGADRNDELNLNLRLFVGTGAAYPVFRNKLMELWLSAGLVFARETYTSGTPTLNLAGFLEGDWELFRYDRPKFNGTLVLQIVPGLTDLGRVRGTTSVVVKYEVFYNFYVGVNFSFTFDTRPPDPTAGNTDYLLSLTIGWSYKK